MLNLKHNPDQPLYKDLSIEVFIDSLLFDMLIDRHFLPHSYEQGRGQHNHFVYEIHFILSGSGTLHIGGREEAVEAGTIYIVAPHIFHNLAQNLNDPITRFFIQFTLKEVKKSDAFFPKSEKAAIKEVFAHLNYFRFPNTAKINDLIEEIRLEMSECALGYYSNLQSLFSRLIVQFVLAAQPNPNKYYFPGKVKDNMRTKIIDNFFANYRESLTIEDLATELNLSGKQTNRILRKYYHTTFKQKLLDTRVEIAIDLLLNSTWRLNKIAEHVGYQNTHNFCAVFAKKMGVAPAQYRNAAAGKTK